MQPKKIPMAAIEQLQRVLESVPECSVQEVTRVQAIRMLAPQISALQSKGYSLGAIAGMLSDKGMAVSAGTLKNYVSLAKVAGGKKTRGKGKKHSKSGGGQSAANATEHRSEVKEAHNSPSRSDSRGGVGSLEKVARGALPPTTTTAGAREASKQPPPRTEEGAQRRSAFVPPPDSEDI